MSETTTDAEARRIDRPSWLPDEYDPDAPLAERLKLLAPIDGGIELHAEGDRYTTTIGEPRGLKELDNGTLRLKTGTGPDTHSWDYELTVPAEGEAFLRSVDPDQDHEAYVKTKTTEMRGMDVRVYGVDAEAWLEQDD